MQKPRLRVARLDEAALEKLRVIEAAFGSTIIALEPQYPLAELSAEQVSRLRALEQELGVVLLAYKTE